MAVESDNDSKISPDDPEYPFIISDYREGPKYLGKEDCQQWKDIIVSDVIKVEWRKMSDPNRHNTWNYFRARLLIKRGDRVDMDEAREIYADLVDKTGFRQFETEHYIVLREIDIAITGKTLYDGRIYA